MSDHRIIRDLLPLSAAGLLDCDQERDVRRHATECPDCAAQLEELGLIALDLAALPAPLPPPHLVTKTAMLLASEADRRQGARMACAASVFGLISVIVTGQVLRLITGEAAVLVWMAWGLTTSLFGAASAILLKVARRSADRSTL